MPTALDPSVLSERSLASNRTKGSSSKAAAVAIVVTEDGRREILGIEFGDSADQVFWA